MKLTLRIEDNGHHCQMTIFANGGNAGKLTLRSEEAITFIAALRSCYGLVVEVQGRLFSDQQDEVRLPDSSGEK
jgi:hypothetical protein